MVTVYVIKSLTKKYRYVGITNDLERRIREHSKKKRFYAPFKILITEIFADYPSAREREKFFKSGQGRSYIDSIEKDAEVVEW